MPRSQRMKLNAGPRSRWPGKNWKSLTIMPRLSRYQFSAVRYLVLCSTTWPSRSTVAGARGDRWVALTRLRSSPKVEVGGRRRRWGVELRGPCHDVHGDAARVQQVDA